MTLIFKIKDALKSKTKYLGFFERYVDVLSKEEYCQIEAKVFDDLRARNDGFWSDIFMTAEHYCLVDKYVLRKLRKSSLVWRLRWLEICIFRLIFEVFDVIAMIFRFKRTYYCNARSTGNADSNNVAFLFTNNNERGQVTRSKPDFCQHDFLISRTKVRGFSCLFKKQITLSDIFKAIHLKCKYPFCHAELIFETIMARDLFKEGISYFVSDAHKHAAFNREAWTPMSRVFLACANDLNISSTVFYTNSIMYDCMYVPKNIDILLLPTDASIPKVAYGVNMEIFYDNPFVPWRKIAASCPQENKVGLLLGDEQNRWADQRISDRKILDVLSQFPGIVCIGRPHPSEMTRPNRVSYYGNLVRDYPFLTLDTRDLEGFFTDVKFIITYSKSTMVELALMSNRHVIEFADNSSFSPNKTTRDLSSGMVEISSSQLDLHRRVNEKLTLGYSPNATDWQAFLSRLNIGLRLRSDTKDCIDRCFR